MKIEIKDIRLHDCISVERTHKDTDRSYYGGTTRGVVIGLNEDGLEVKTPQGNVETFKAKEEDYNVSFSRFSEVEFKKLIVDELEDAEKRIVDAIKARDDVKKWKHHFTFEMTLLGKLVSYAIHKNNQIEKD